MTRRGGGVTLDDVIAPPPPPVPDVTELTASVTELAAAAACDRIPLVMSCTLDSVGKLGPCALGDQLLLVLPGSRCFMCSMRALLQVLCSMCSGSQAAPCASEELLYVLRECSCSMCCAPCVPGKQLTSICAGERESGNWDRSVAAVCGRVGSSYASRWTRCPRRHGPGTSRRS